jgi:hypothetical protein
MADLEQRGRPSGTRLRTDTANVHVSGPFQESARSANVDLQSVVKIRRGIEGEGASRTKADE